ncbi:MAG: hypothetical protein H7833_12820 [Magnetococcus sp. DMHC-1]
MTESAIREAVESYSRGEISRRELGNRIEQEVDFADALHLLRQYHLPLPHRPSDPLSPGVQLIRQLALRHKSHV